MAPPPGQPKPAAKPQTGPIAGGVVLGIGVVLLIIGAANHHLFVLVIIGLVAAAWGLWRLVTASGNNAKPPGQP